MRRRLKRLRGGLRHLADPPGVILLYHRVARPDMDPWGISVRPEYFAQQLEVLRRRTRPVPLEALPQRRRGRAVAVTFDDGYADNLHQALPLLEHWGVPATFFVVSGTLGQARPFWWDELAGLILQAPALPEQLRLAGRGEVRTWLLGDAARERVCPAWRAETVPDAGPREQLYLDLYWRLRGQSAPDREAELRTLRTWAAQVSPGAGEVTVTDPHNRPLTPAELRLLAAHPLAGIGAHTVTHPPLGDLDPAAQWTEIRDGRLALERELGRPVTSFSLPHGSCGEHTAELVREAGFLRACTSSGRGVRGGAPALGLPRFSVGDWSGEEFAARLEHWLGQDSPR